MKLILVYGPPAVGKLTVTKALAEKINYKLVDNHTLVNPIAYVFGWESPERSRLADIFRVELFRSAAKCNIDLITTSGGAGKSYNDFFQRIIKAVTSENGEVIFVRLTAPTETLFKRVENDSRATHQKMMTGEWLQKMFDQKPDVFARALVPPHLEIDTSLHSAEESAQMIIDYYHLQPAE